MKKSWKFVGLLVVVVLLLGGICIGAGYLTGADSERIYDVLDKEYDLTVSLNAASATAKDIASDFSVAFTGSALNGSSRPGETMQ